MESYSIRFKRSAEKDLRSLPPSQVSRVLDTIDDLRSEPLPRRAIKLSGAERLYRVRVGAYRVLYEVDTEAQQITIHYVRHRRDAYRRL